MKNGRGEEKMSLEQKEIDNLSQLVRQYAEDKSVLDKYKKRCDTGNGTIKKIMAQAGFSEFVSGEYVAHYTIQNRESMDEEMLLNIIDNTPGLTQLRSEIVKTREYVDFDALENIIYAGKIPNSVLQEMNKAKQTKEIEVLRITKNRG